MPMWAPPTPPQDDNDVYVDQTMLFLHEGSVMPESQLPPVYVRKDHRKPRVETITTRKQKQRKEEAPRVPRSLFDRPSSALVKMRRELKMQRLKAAGLGIHQKQPLRPTSLPAPLSHKAPMVEQSEGHPEWLIHEDWALLQAVSDCCHLPLNLTGYQNGHIPNWDLVADVVNGVSRTHRSIKQCRARYENVIIPREEGRILYDVSPRKQKKNKSTYKTKNNRPMKTSQLFTQDNNSSISLLYSLRFDSILSMAAKRPAPMRQTLNNPTMKNPKHLAVLQENNINYDQPLNPMQVAAIRAERIQREKKANTAATASAEAAQRPAQTTAGVGERGAQGVVQAVGGVAASAPTVAQAVAGQQLHSLVSAATPTTIIAGAAAPRAAVAQGMTAVSIARTLAATGNIVAVTGSLGRGRVQVHDITTVAGPVTGAQVAAQTARASQQPSAQKMAALASTSALAGGTVHQQLAKGLNQQINLLHPIMRSQTPGTATQAQQLGHKVRFTKQAVVRTMPGLTDEQLKALKVRQLQNKAQGGQQVKLQAAQIMQQVGQSGSTSSAPVTLVKSVPAPAGASAVPIPVSINVTMAQGQQKTALPSRGPTVSQLQHQRMQLLQQQRKGVPLQQSHRVTALAGGVRSGQIPLIIPPKTPLTGQLLHQYIKQQPAIISVSQAQTLPTMVAKVSLPPSTPIHTLSAAAPIPVTQVAAAAGATPSAGGSGAPSHHTPTVATINMASVSQATHATVVKSATVDLGQAAQGTAKMATLGQSLVSPQPLPMASTTLQPAQAATLVGAGGTQHRVLTATPTTLPQATAVVVSTTTLAQPSSSTSVVQQQQQQPAQQLGSAATVVSAQAVASPSTMATVVTQTQSPQTPATSQPSSAQLTAQQQQQLPKGPYTMRTRNQPKHS